LASEASVLRGCVGRSVKETSGIHRQKHLPENVETALTVISRQYKLYLEVFLYIKKIVQYTKLDKF